MPLEIQPATEADIRRAVELEFKAYGPNPFSAILFPGPKPDGDTIGTRAEYLTTQRKGDATTRWSKVIDTDLPQDEQMIAFSKWHVYTEKPQLTPREFGPECNVEACQKLFGGIQQQRFRILGDRPYVCRGAGTLLIKQVLEEAQRRNLMAYLESSEAGHSLYTGCGFKDVELHEVDMSKWGATETHKTWAMDWKPEQK
ncbi:hypothetical protein JX266_005227 [Neoarthrinium moseri]|nr:hypothetical protein JX266_005227 [Neoarthrinium moseri]